MHRVSPLICLLLVCLCLYLPVKGDEDSSESLYEEVRHAIAHAFRGYMTCAYPHDNLRPISCSGANLFEHDRGISVTLFDSLDILLLAGHYDLFCSAMETMLLSHPDFEIDAVVSVFETNIRVLGGLISAMMSLSFEEVKTGLDAYCLESNTTCGHRDQSWQTKLFGLAVDLGDRLLESFHSNPLGIPSERLNLAHGPIAGATNNVAGATTYLLEFRVLSELSCNPSYYQAAVKAFQAVHSRRNPDTGLVGTLIDRDSGRWVNSKPTIAANADSFYEYFLKGCIQESSLSAHSSASCMTAFSDMYGSVNRHIKREGYFGDTVESLELFWPGLLIQWGDVSSAHELFHNYYGKVWKNGFPPERMYIRGSASIPGFQSYPLRPEFLESLFYGEAAMGDRYYASMAANITRKLLGLKTPHGYAGLKDVARTEPDDHMESFFISETLKYALLLSNKEHWLYRYLPRLLFTTEGHLIPLGGKFPLQLAQDCPSMQLPPMFNTSNTSMKDESSHIDSVDATLTLHPIQCENPHHEADRFFPFLWGGDTDMDVGSTCEVDATGFHGALQKGKGMPIKLEMLGPTKFAVHDQGHIFPQLSSMSQNHILLSAQGYEPMLLQVEGPPQAVQLQMEDDKGTVFGSWTGVAALFGGKFVGHPNLQRHLTTYYGGYGCHPISHALMPPSGSAVWIMRRGTCSFEDKARLAQQQGAAALVVINAEESHSTLQGGGAAFPMAGTANVPSPQGIPQEGSSRITAITIPLVMLSFNDGNALLTLAWQSEDGTSLPPKEKDNLHLTLTPQRNTSEGGGITVDIVEYSQAGERVSVRSTFRHQIP